MRNGYSLLWRLSITLLAVAGVWRALHPSTTIHAATMTVAPGQSFLIVLGVGDRAAAAWDGTISVDGAAVQVIRGWRFAATDAINGTTGWKMNTRVSPALNPPGPLQENGVIVKIAASDKPVMVNVKTTQGDFSFSNQDLPFGVTKSFMNGRAVVLQTGAQFQLSSSDEEEDFPAMARAGDDVYLAYTEFVHGDRSLATAGTVTKAIADFGYLARPAGGDQVFLMHYSISQRLWTGPVAITGTGEDIMRTAVAVDGLGRAWVIYSARRGANFDLYARNSLPDGTLSAEIRLTTDEGTDVFPVAATDASGRVWVAWQGYRGDNLEILTTVQDGDSFWPETVVSTSAKSDWDPAIAAAPNGEVAISWDSYDKGDYDVYLRRVKFNGQVTLDDPIVIAASTNFEARSSLAFDQQNRLWIAYELAGARWGKDFGAFDTSGLPLYSGHTIQVRCLIGNDLYTTNDDIANTLPGQEGAELFLPTTKAPFNTQPDPTLPQKRPANSSIGPPAGPRNTFPRIATDSEGTVYLAFRQQAGTGLSPSRSTGGVSVGSIWISPLIYFDGAQWRGPGYLGFTDGVSDNRPAVIAVQPGKLLIAHSSDHRMSPAGPGSPQQDGVSSDIFQSEVTIARTQQTPQLRKIGSIMLDDPDPAAGPEAAQAAFSRSYRPLVNGQRYQLVRGDFHRHTEISFDGGRDGPIVDSYRYSIDAASLGWSGCCDHDNGEGREYTWWLTQKLSDAYFMAGRFVPMFYYERSVGYPEGHRNVLFAQRGVRPLPRLPVSSANNFAPAPDTTMLYAYLHFFGGISAPHTSATDQGTDWRNSDPEVEPFVEIYQGDRQDYEMPASPRANTAGDSISGYEEKGYVSNALRQDIRLGFEASSDHVSTHISFTNIWVTEPTRAGIMEAMHKRRIYGSTDNIVADFRSGGHFMGEQFAVTSPPRFTVRLYGTAPFKEVVVVKDGNVVFSTSGDKVLAFTHLDTSAQKGKTSYYYVRGLQTDGQIVWVSPMWVTLQ